MTKRKSERRKGGVVAGDDDKHFCAFAIWVKYMFTRSQMRNPAAQRQFSYSPAPMAACLEMQPPPVADFWNSYLDEWLKLRHSQQVSPLLFKEEWDSCHLLMHCLPSRMQIPSLHRCLLAPFPLQWVPKESPWVIDQVPWHHWKHVGSLPTQPARQKHSCMLIWCDQWDRRNKGGLLRTVDLWPLKSDSQEQDFLTSDR